VAFIRTFDSVGQDWIPRNYAVNVIGDRKCLCCWGSQPARLIEPLRTSLMVQIGVLVVV
jgi:hypothetical protein